MANSNETTTFDAKKAALDEIGSGLGQATGSVRRAKRRAEYLTWLQTGVRTHTRKKDGKTVEHSQKAVDHLRTIEKFIRIGGAYSDIPSEVAERFDWKSVAAGVERFAHAAGLNPAELLGALGVGIKARKVPAKGSNKGSKAA